MRTLTQGQICRSKASGGPPTNGCLFAIITPTFADDPPPGESHDAMRPRLRSSTSIQEQKWAASSALYPSATSFSITFFGVDYHSHLGTKFGGMTIYHPEKGFQRQIHNITNTPFRTRFEPDIADMKGNCGIGCISDDDPQPLLLRSHLGLFAITTVGIINNADDLIERYFSNNNSQFAMSPAKVNSTELVGALINRKQSIVEGIRYAQDIIQGSETIMLLQPDGIIVARDKARSSAGSHRQG